VERVNKKTFLVKIALDYSHGSSRVNLGASASSFSTEGEHYHQDVVLQPLENRQIFQPNVLLGLTFFHVLTDSKFVNINLEKDTNVMSFHIVNQFILTERDNDLTGFSLENLSDSPQTVRIWAI
jgi:hypothetical protein